MRYLYTTKPDKHCNEVSKGVYGRPAHTYEYAKLIKSGWRANPDELRTEEAKSEETEVKVRDELEEQYVELFGKKPHHKLKRAKMQEQIDEALSND